MKNIHLGVNLSFAMNRYVEPEEWAKIVKEDVGVKYVQFFTDLLDPFFSPSSFRSRMCQRIKELCGKKSLKIHSVFTGTSPHCFNLLLHPEKVWRGYKNDFSNGFLWFWELFGRFFPKRFEQ